MPWTDDRSRRESSHGDLRLDRVSGESASIPLPCMGGGPAGTARCMELPRQFRLSGSTNASCRTHHGPYLAITVTVIVSATAPVQLQFVVRESSGISRNYGENSRIAPMPCMATFVRSLTRGLAFEESDTKRRCEKRHRGERALALRNQSWLPPLRVWRQEMFCVATTPVAT
jgi:hypothetical protein